jgi:hypothetical protein
MRILKNVLTVTLASALVLVAFPAAAVVGSWSTPAEVSLTAGDAYDPQVTVDSTGLATAVWWGSNGSVFLIQSSCHPIATASCAYLYSCRYRK